MKKLAASALVSLLLVTVSPAFAQPFADTPTNHWAYDAIAELAAKGLIEGYPDGTFKGDRAMTRYEMAMVVARLLARIESIQIPTPAPPLKPEVTKADIDKVLRLVNEFRAELAAKNVRLTAVEEELNAIKAKLDNVRITGGVRMREDLNQFAPNPANNMGAGVGPTLPGNGNPNTGATDASGRPRGNRTREVIRVLFDGSVTPDVHFLVDVMTSGFVVFNSTNAPTLAVIDDAFFDWKNAFGWPIEIWLGRFGGGASGGANPGRTFPVQFGPFGLLLNTASSGWQAATQGPTPPAFNVADGARLALHLAQLADLQLQAVLIRVNGNVGAFSFPSGEDAFGGDVNFQVLPGLRLGGYFVGNSIANAGSSPFTSQAPLGTLYHLYGGSKTSVNPVTPNCPVAGTRGIQCPALGNGFGAYVDWNIIPGITLDGEWAQWNDNVLGGSDNGYHVLVTWDLKKLLNIGPGLVLTTGYQNYGQNFYPPYGVAADPCCWTYLFPGNISAFDAGLRFSPIKNVTLYGVIITGNHVSNSMSVLEWETGVVYRFAPNTSITLKYRDLRLGGVDQYNVWRGQFDYTF